jgi:hypothetical protein
MIRRRLLVCLAGAGIALTASGCGSSSSSSRKGATASTAITTTTTTATGTTGTTAGTTGTTAGDPLTVWKTKTEQLCAQKRAAVAALGNIHITYAGIARVGLPKVKLALERYLGRLVGVLEEFHARQHQLTPPASIAAIFAQAEVNSHAAEAATVLLRTRIAGVQSAQRLASAFSTWLATVKTLAARSDKLAHQLHLTGCLSGATASPMPSGSA